MSSILDHMSLKEWCADLFALADLVADWRVEGIYASIAPADRSRTSSTAMKALAPGVTGCPVHHRTTLRLALYGGQLG
jgi:hypothetical protein